MENTKSQPISPQSKAPEPQTELKFSDLRAANLSRCSKWHPRGLSEWSLSDWGVATAGEMGEALNVIKKLNRERDGIAGNSLTIDELRRHLADEIADVAIYLDILAASEGIDLAAAIVEKFNRTSIKVGFPERLPTLESCKNIGQARALIARYEATHAALGMELKSIFDKLSSVRAASTGTGWITVEDRLPATNSAVLFWTNDGMWESGYFRLDGKIEWQSERTGPQDEPIYFRADQVTHWMIPAPPVASQKGKEKECS